MGKDGLFAAGIPEIDLKSIDPFQLDWFNYTFDHVPPIDHSLQQRLNPGVE
jgi:hypothetical protein